MSKTILLSGENWCYYILFDVPCDGMKVVSGGYVKKMIINNRCDWILHIRCGLKDRGIQYKPKCNVS